MMTAESKGQIADILGDLEIQTQSFYFEKRTYGHPRIKACHSNIHYKKLGIFDFHVDFRMPLK